MKHGTLTTKGNQVELRFERRLAHPPEKVWRALTDKYLVVLEGSDVLTINGMDIQLSAGREFVIPHGARTSGRYTAGTRTIHAHGGKRLERAGTS